MRAPAVLVRIALACGCLFSVFPIVWIMLTSVKTPGDYFANPFRWIPRAVTFEHYARLAQDLDGTRSVLNSLVLAGSSMLLTLVVAVPAAYAVTRSGGRVLSRAPSFVLALRALPPVILLIPLYLMYSQVGLIDTHVGLILAFATFNVPFAIWMLKGFFEDFPAEIQEAAMLDGLSEAGSLARVVVPVIAPAVVVVGFFTFLAAWNELMLSTTLTGDRTQTVTKLLSSLLQSPTGTDFGAAAAISFVSMLPGLVLVVLCQRFLVQGLTSGGVK